jgi:hypothetical protein
MHYQSANLQKKIKMSKRARSTEDYITITLRVKKELINNTFEQLPRIVNDEELWFPSFPGQLNYKALDEGVFNEFYFNDGGMNAHVESHLHDMDQSDLYSSYREDKPKTPYEYNEIDYEDVLFLEDGQTLCINNMNDATLSGRIIKVPIYKKIKK